MNDEDASRSDPANVYFSVPPIIFARPSPPPMPRFLSLFLILWTIPSATAFVADTTEVAPRISITPKPEAFYSPARGIGVGAKITVDHLGFEGSNLQLDITTMTRHGEYHAFAYSSDPFESQFYVGIGGSYVGTQARRFYGLGPASRKEDSVPMFMRRASGELRIGVRPFEDFPLTVQPSSRILYTLTELADDTEGLLQQLDRPSAENFRRALTAPSTGIDFGVDLILDFMEDPVYSHKGILVQAGLRHYEGFDDDPARFRSATMLVHGAWPVGLWRTVVEGRVIGRVARPVGDRPIPFYALPTLDADLMGAYSRFRFAGNDLFLASASLRFPLFDVFDWVGAEVFTAVHLGNVYDNLFSQFSPSITFDKNIPQNLDRFPLRPAFAIGGHIITLSNHRPVLSGQIGFSPEGFQLASLTFQVDLRTRRPFVR